MRLIALAAVPLLALSAAASADHHAAPKAMDKPAKVAVNAALAAAVADPKRDAYRPLDQWRRPA
jgi:predicted methyltransferase